MSRVSTVTFSVVLVASVAAPWGLAQECPSFVRYVQDKATASALSLADLNEDGRGDLIVGYGTVRVGFGLESGLYSPSIYIGSKCDGRITAADLDGDGDIDLAGAAFDSYCAKIYFNDGSGAFLLSTQYNVTSGPHHTWIQAADFDGDADIDLLIGGGQSMWMVNDGQGQFTLLPASIGGYERVIATDLNGDGIADLVAAGSGKLHVRLGLGGLGQFSVTTLPIAAEGVDLAEVNGDANVDLVTWTGGASGGTVTVFAGDGKGSFVFLSAMALPYGVSQASAADLDGDGDGDLVIGTPQSVPNPPLVLAMNDGGVFGEPLLQDGMGTDGMWPGKRIIAADLDDDGDIDLVTGSHWGKIGVEVLLNQCLPKCPADIDQDGVVGPSDLGVLLSAYGTCVGDPAFTPKANLAPSGGNVQCIDQADLGVLLKEYGTACR